MGIATILGTVTAAVAAVAVVKGAKRRFRTLHRNFYRAGNREGGPILDFAQDPETGTYRDKHRTDTG